MKLRFLPIISLILCGSVWAQITLLRTGAGTSAIACIPPVGTVFNEFFGESTTPCGFVGTSNCNAYWIVGSGSAPSVVPTPGTPPANTACSSSLKFILDAATDYISSVGYTPTIAAAGTFDVTMTIYLASSGLASFDAQALYTPSFDTAGGQFPCRINWHTTDGINVTLRGESETIQGADTATVTTNTWHTVVLHCAAGASASYVTLDGGAQKTFTQTSRAWNFQTIGSTAGATKTMTYYIGNFKVDSAGGGLGPPYMYADFENSTTGTTLTAAILAAGTHCGNGTWTTANGTGPQSAETVSTAENLSLFSAVTACGTSYNDSAGTRVANFDLSATVSQYEAYTWLTNSGIASGGEWFRTDLPSADTGFYDMGGISNLAGSDFAALMMTGNSGSCLLYLETNANPNGNPDVGTKYACTPSTKYFFRIRFRKYIDATTVHELDLYDSNCTLLSHQEKFARSVTPSPPSFWSLGRLGDSGTPARFFRYDNLQLDYVTGNMVTCH